VPRKPSPATIVAITALVVALGGTAIAASRYIITNTSQIKPSVVNALRGLTVVARPRSLATVTTGSQPVSVPLGGNDWTQRPGEQELLTAQATITLPASSGCREGRGPEANLWGQVKVTAGALKALFQPLVRPSPVGRTLRTINLLSPALRVLPESAMPTIHHAAVTFYDTCGRGGGIATEHFTINSVSIDAIGLH
jgi:hypothetical protein